MAEFLFTDENGNQPEEGADQTAITFVCPRSRPGKPPRKCTQRLGDWNGDTEAPTMERPIDCPACGWKGALAGGVLIEAPTV